MTDRYDPDRARAEELSADIDLMLHLFDLRMIAAARGDLATLRRINDFDAARSYTGPLMEPGEFSALLVREGEEAPTGVDLYNACMGIQDTEGFKGLPQDRRAQGNNNSRTCNGSINGQTHCASNIDIFHIYSSSALHY